MSRSYPERLRAMRLGAMRLDALSGNTSVALARPMTLSNTSEKPCAA